MYWRDWSSAVCSSDLSPSASPAPRQDMVGHFDHRHRGAELAEGDAEFEADIAGADHHEFFRQFQIGRASCRERGQVWEGCVYSEQNLTWRRLERARTA